MFKFKKKKILIIGDMFLDDYIFGDVNRISPEAPVPVLDVKPQFEYKLGGAANTALNVASLGGEVTLLTLYNPSDTSGKICERLFLASGVKVPLVKASAPTSSKVRVVCNGQQMIRLDYQYYPQSVNVVELEANTIDLILESDLVIVSDYAKGLLTEEYLKVIGNACQAFSKPLIVDPKPKNAEFYSNVSYITPNTQEMLDIAYPRTHDPIKAAINYSTAHKCGVLLTQGANGISLIKGGEFVKSWPTQAKEVFDVTGAGDTVVAVFSLALACGADEDEAILLANKAAGIVVGKHGTATVTAEELGCV